MSISFIKISFIPVLFLFVVFSSFSLFVPVQSQESDLDSQTLKPTAQVKGYIWNKTLNLWARTHCDLKIPPVPAGCDGSFSNNKLIYEHYGKGRITGEAYSPFFQKIIFDKDKINEEIDAGNVPGIVKGGRKDFCPGFGADEYGARIVDTSSTKAKALRVVGCAYAPSIKAVILLSPYSSDGSKIPLSDLKGYREDTSIEWEGLESWEGIRAGIREGSSSEDDGKIADPFIFLYNCGFHVNHSEDKSTLDLLFWSFGEDIDATDNRTCYKDSPSVDDSTSLDTRIGSSKGKKQELSKTVRFGQKISIALFCGSFRAIATESFKNLFSDGTSSEEFEKIEMALRNGMDYLLVVTFPIFANVICKDETRKFFAEDMYTISIRVETSKIVDFEVLPSVISKLDIAGGAPVNVSYTIDNLSNIKTTCSLTRSFGNSEEKDLINEFKLCGFGTKEVKSPDHFPTQIVSADTTYNLECKRENTVKNLGQIFTKFASVKTLPSLSRERLFSNNIKTRLSIKREGSSDDVKIDGFGKNEDKDKDIDSISYYIYNKSGELKTSKIINFEENANRENPKRIEGFYSNSEWVTLVAFANNDRGVSGPKSVFIDDTIMYKTEDGLDDGPLEGGDCNIEIPKPLKKESDESSTEESIDPPTV